jgi:hypothetical protein
MSDSTFDHLRQHNPIVAHVIRAGGTAEDCAVALSVANDRLVDRAMLLEGIAPRKIRLPDGRVTVWRCPDDLVPETGMWNAPARTSRTRAISESDRALTMIREATDHALDEAGLVEAVAVLISQRDNARDAERTYRTKLKELGHEYV